MHYFSIEGTQCQRAIDRCSLSSVSRHTTPTPNNNERLPSAASLFGCPTPPTTRARHTSPTAPASTGTQQRRQSARIVPARCVWRPVGMAWESARGDLGEEGTADRFNFASRGARLQTPDVFHTLAHHHAHTPRTRSTNTQAAGRDGKGKGGEKPPPVVLVSARPAGGGDGGRGRPPDSGGRGRRSSRRSGGGRSGGAWDGGGERHH